MDELYFLVKRLWFKIYHIYYQTFIFCKIKKKEGKSTLKMNRSQHKIKLGMM